MLSHTYSSQHGSYELVDNGDFGNHQQVLTWIAEHYLGPLNVATGYVSLEGLDALAKLASARGQTSHLLIGVAPEAMTDSASEAVIDHFQSSVSALRRQRDFSAFPAGRRAVLERVARFLESDSTQVRRYIHRFLHGKAYVIGKLDDAGSLIGPGAALVSSANLTQGGLLTNLELGMVHYQPNVVGMALGWYQRLWDDAQDFREELLELLWPPSLEGDPQTVFLRALLELYDGELDDTPQPDLHTLTAFQRDGLARAKRILDRYGGVLYADGVGMGKTEIGVQFIREHTQELGQHVLVISPAQLRDRLWEQRLSEENLPGTVVSYQQLAQDRQLSFSGEQRILPVDKDVYRFVIIDEAHAYRNVGNTWYAALDRLMGGTPKKLLLLTATPVNNSLWDLHNLFLLFGRHDSAFTGDPLRIPSLRRFFAEAGASKEGNLSEDMLFPLIDALTVRRDRSFIKENYRNERFSDGTPVKFPEPELRERRYDLDRAHPGIVQSIYDGIDGLKMARYRLSSPSYRIDSQEVSASEEALAGLIQSQLLKRFESSWYAALQTMLRMRDGNDVLIHVISERGVVPSPDVIRDLVGDSADDDTFLSADTIDEALAGSEGGLPADRFNDQFLTDLQKDREILANMAAQLESLQNSPDPKLDMLREVMMTTPSQKVAIFTAFQDTASYLKDRIESHSDVLGGRTWTVVIGSETSADARTRELERFCPESVSGIPGFQPDGGEVDVIVSTDILSEGQNLQQAQAVLSYDMPWNPQRVVQRNGRIIRLRSPHDTAYLYTLLPKQGDLDRLLELEAKLQAKIMAANASVGMETPVLAAIDVESQVYADLSSFAKRLSHGDSTLLDEQEDSGESGSAFAGELFRAYLRRATEEGEVRRLQGLPWGIGSAFVQGSPTLSEPAVFFACRTRRDERYWRVVSQSGEILHRDDLPMLRLIDPHEQPGNPIPDELDLEKLFGLAAADICDAHNAMLDPEANLSSLPASQRWALDVLRAPDTPAGAEFDRADEALSVGRNNLVRRQLSQLRRRYEGEGMSVADCSRQIVNIVEEFGLRPFQPTESPTEITEDDLGVVCYQVVLPAQLKTD